MSAKGGLPPVARSYLLWTLSLILVAVMGPASTSVGLLDHGHLVAMRRYRCRAIIELCSGKGSRGVFCRADDRRRRAAGT